MFLYNAQNCHEIEVCLFGLPFVLKMPIVPYTDFTQKCQKFEHLFKVFRHIP